MLIRDGATLVRGHRRRDRGAAKPGPGADAAAASQPDLPLNRGARAGHAPPETPGTGLRETPSCTAASSTGSGPTPLAEDQLIRDLARRPAKVAPMLTDLELDGRIARHPGGLVARPDRGLGGIGARPEAAATTFRRRPARPP